MPHMFWAHPRDESIIRSTHTGTYLGVLASMDVPRRFRPGGWALSLRIHAAVFGPIFSKTPGYRVARGLRILRMVVPARVSRLGCEVDGGSATQITYTWHPMKPAPRLDLSASRPKARDAATYFLESFPRPAIRATARRRQPPTKARRRTEARDRGVGSNDTDGISSMIFTPIA